jgi:hypothetical protein
MNRRTRYFMTGAAALMVMGLGAGLVAYYNGGFPALSASPTGGPAELSFVPADASVVAFANVRDVMNSEFRQRLKAAMPHETEAHNDFQQKTGINIETDIDYVVAWMGPEGTEASGLVLVRGTGNLDHARLEALATEHGGQVTIAMMTIRPIRMMRSRRKSLRIMRPVAFTRVRWRFSIRGS